MLIWRLRVGLIAGYFGGKADTAIICDTVDAPDVIPSLLFVIIIMTFLRGTFSGEPSGIWQRNPHAGTRTSELHRGLVRRPQYRPGHHRLVDASAAPRGQNTCR